MNTPPSLLSSSASHVTHPLSPILPHSSPEAQGVDSGAIQAFVTAADQQINALHSFILVRHGHIVAAGWWNPYAAETPHVMFSLSKSFTATAVGLAISEGLLSVDDAVLKFFPEDAPADPTAKLKAMRVRDLLCMSSGHETEPALSSIEAPWTQSFLAHPVPHKPGTHFLYNSPGTYMLSAILQKVTGQTTLDYLRPRLFEPLGIEQPTWGTSPQGITLGGWGLYLRTEDIAKFGQLYLQRGQWHGQQLVPAPWVEAATARQTSNGSNPHSDWEQGYGFQFWRCRHGAYRGDGAHGQFCLVLPEQDAVVAITAGTNDLQGVVSLVWDKLLPALQSAAPLPANETAQRQLQQTLTNLTMRQPTGSATSPLAAALNGQEYHFPANEQNIETITVEANADGSVAALLMRVNGVAQRIVCGYGSWLKSRLSLGAFTDQPVAASGVWAADGTYTVRLCFYETANSVTLMLRPAGEELLCQVEYHPGVASQPPLVGRLPAL